MYLKIRWSTLMIFIAIALSIGCDKCKDVLCFTPPPPFEIEFLDSETRENLITNGTYVFNQIEVKNTINGNNVNFDSVSHGTESYIRLIDIGWKTETINYAVSIPVEFEFLLQVNVERLEGECCDFTQINELAISNYEFEKSTSTERISILIKR